MMTSPFIKEINRVGKCLALLGRKYHEIDCQTIDLEKSYNSKQEELQQLEREIQVLKHQAEIIKCGFFKMVVGHDSRLLGNTVTKKWHNYVQISNTVNKSNANGELEEKLQLYSQKKNDYANFFRTYQIRLAQLKEEADNLAREINENRLLYADLNAKRCQYEERMLKTVDHLKQQPTPVYSAIEALKMRKKGSIS